MILELNSIPTDDGWLKKREKEWKTYEEQTFFSGATPKKEVLSYKDYFMQGDIDGFVESCVPHFSSLIYLSPVQTLDDLKKIIEKSFRWCVDKQQDPEWIAKNGFKGDWDKFLMASFEHCLFAYERINNDYHLSIDLFKWIYGEKYDPGRVIQLVSGDPLSRMHVEFNISYMCMRMIDGLCGYLWHPNRKRTCERYKFIADYFVSLYPHNDRVCFSKKIPSSINVTIDGKKYLLGEFTRNRGFIAAMHNIVTEYDEEEGVEELVLSDSELLEKIREGLKYPHMPPEYYELEKFVIKQGYDCLYASE